MTSSADASSASNSSDDDLDQVGVEAAEAKEKEEDKCPSLEESLHDITRLLGMTLDNRFHEAYRGTEKW